MQRFFPFSIVCACLILLQATMLPSLNHNTLRAENKKIILQHADTIEGGEGESGGYRSVAGNVLFLHNNITLKCNRATQYEKENKIVLTGSVFIADNAVEIYGDSGVYYPDRETGELSGNVRGRMLNNSLSAKAKKAVVNKATSQIWLYDNVIAWHEQKQISGDMVVLHLKEESSNTKHRHLEKIEVEGRAFFAAKDTLSLSPVVYDQLSSNKMVIKINDHSKITGITGSSESESLYHLYDEKHQPSGINYSSGNIIEMFFSEGRLNRVKVTGNVQGKQYPERFRGDKSINLQKFVWREEENPFKNKKSLP
jgi:lipopolysaccharide export system protein LptA